MNKIEHTEPRDQMREHFEDEIELIDYLRVIWKWKWLIIGGTLLCILATAIYGFVRPAYKISATIEIDPKAKLDPLNTIKSMIEYGIFNRQILNNISNVEGATVPESLSFEVAVQKDLNILNISHQSPNPDLGKVVLTSLIKYLKQRYKERIEEKRSHFDKTINKKAESIKNIQANIQQTELTQTNTISGLRLKIKDVEANIQIIERQFKSDKVNKENAIRRHAAYIESLKENIRILKSTMEHEEKVFQKAKLSSEKTTAQREAVVLNSKNKKGHEDIFMQAAAIQQVINYPVILRNQINSLIFQHKAFSREISSESNIIRDLQSQIQILEMQKNISMQREQDKIKDLEAQVQIFDIQKNISIQKEQDSIRDIENQIQISEMRKSSSIKKVQDSIRDLEAQIRLINLKVEKNTSAEQNKITLLRSEIENLKRDKDKITGMMVKQPATASTLPTKYKAKRNAFLAGVVGFFFLVFLAFFIEYIKNALQRIQKTNIHS